MQKNAARQAGEAPLVDALWRFFERSDTPAALVGPDQRVAAANRAFGIRVGAQTEGALIGVPLGELLVANPPITDIRDLEGHLPVTLPGGRAAMANLSDGGDHTVVTLDAGLEGARLAQAMHALEDQGRVFSIGRLLSLLMAEEDLVGVVAQGLRELFPSRPFCIRVVDPKSMHLTSLYAEGTLIPEERDRLTLKRSAVAKTRLPPKVLQSEAVRVRAGYHRIFEGSQAGLGVPLVAGNQLFGMLNLEGQEVQFHDAEADERLLIALANQLSVSLRNAKLLSEARYLRGYLEKLVDDANALIVVIDRQGAITVFNRACQALSGFSREEVLGKGFVELVAPEDRPRLTRVVAASLKGRSVDNVEVTILANDGRKIRAAFNTATVYGADGAVESIVATGNDLTRLWELERQVIQAEKLASLGQFAAAVVHELNNPLTSITVYAEFLRDRLGEVGTGSDVEKAGRILESSDRILRFTQSLVAYARPTEERLTRLAVEAVVAESVHLCEHVINERKVEVDQRFEGQMPTVMANRGKLQQVFVNLITNACHALPSGGHLRLTGGADGEGFVEVAISDDGHGMPPEVAERIFNPFFSTKAPGKGTGLGLSIVQGIIHGHGGSIAVDSVQGTGTTFTIRLPVDGLGRR